MWLRLPLPGSARAPDGPDSPLPAPAAATVAKAPSGRASRRLDTLSQAGFAAWLDSRPRGRSGGALFLLRRRQGGEAAAEALAEASLRAVRPTDRVGHAGGGAIAIWLEGLPPPLAGSRAERLRLALQRQGLSDVELVVLPVAAEDARPTAALLAAAAERLGRLTEVPQ